jgi:recombination protein RecA
LGQGRDSVKAILLDNPELMEELEKKIKEKAGLGAASLKVEKEEE